MVGTFAFEGRPKALHGGIVQAIARAAHTDGDVGKLSMPYGGLWELIDALGGVAEQTETVP